MSDPYGQNPGGSNPYGQSPAGGGNPYGGDAGNGGYGGYSAPQDGFNQPPKTDGVSIASLVLSLLCCTGLIGLILGFVGLSRTKGGQRKGRGFAIAGIVIGIVSVLATVAGGAFLIFFANSVVTPGKAEVGQCVDVDEDDGTVLMYKKECSEEHDAEIVGVEKVDSDNIDDIKEGMGAYCLELIKPEDLTKLTDYLPTKALIEDPKKVEVGDHLVCYVEPGKKLDEPIL